MCYFVSRYVFCFEMFNISLSVGSLTNEWRSLTVKRKSYGVIELSDEFSFGQPEKVCWISRHVLTEEQEKVIYYLHRQNVIVRHYNITFTDLDETIDQLRHFSSFAFVYAIIPKKHFDNIRKGLVSDVQFRTMPEYYDDDNNLRFSSVKEHTVNKGSYRSQMIFNRNDLSFHLGREKNDPAHMATLVPLAS